MIQQVNGLIKQHLVKIIAILFLAFGFYLDNTYVSTSKHSTTQRELDTLKVKFRMYVNQQELKDLNHDKDLQTLSRRFENKIKVINGHTEWINAIENDVIRLEK